MKDPADRQDVAFDRLIGRGLGAAVQSADPCPPVELVAAWHDRSLDPRERPPIEAHLSACARCQAVVAELARTEPEVVYARPREEAKAWTWHLRWLVPVATAVVVGAVGLATYRSAGVPSLPSSPALVSDAAEPQPAPPAVASGAQQPAAPEGPAEQPAASGSLAAPVQAPVQTVARQVPPAPAAEGAVRERQLAADAIGAAKGEAEAKAVARKPEVVQAEARADDVQRPAEAARFETDRVPQAMAEERAEALDKRAAPAPAAPMAMGGVAPALKTRAASVARPAGRVGSVAPDGTSWKHERPGFVSRSDDRGGTWTEQALPIREPLASISAVSRVACWAVGGRHIVRTSDGATWRMVTPPVDAVFVDVSASGAASAIVRTAGGESYATSDAGSTWHRRDQ